MYRSKGFTLIELISTIIIIGVIALISTPIVLNVVDGSKQKAYERTIVSIEQAASNYSIYNELGYNRLFKTLKLSEIQDKGYLKAEDIIDPRNDGSLEGCVLYRWLPESNQYEFQYKNSCNEEDFYPEVVINILNDNEKEWMQEKLKFEIEKVYTSYKYCVGDDKCTPSQEYTATTTIDEVGKNIYVCATGYYGDEVGSTTCTKAYNVDIAKPALTINSINTTSSKIVVDASCEDDISGIKSLEYSINDGAYQTENIFSNLKIGSYKLKVRCMDNALNEELYEKTVNIIQL